MKNKLTTITLLSIGVMLIAPPVLADDEPVKLELSILGSLTRTDTYFEITDSEYLNISLQSSEEIIVSLESIPKTISLQIEASTSTNFTTLTIEGLEVNTTYYKFEDSYKNEAVFVSDENGSYSWTQDLIQPYHVWFQPGENGTVFLPEDCDDYGIWNGLTSTCILAQNLTESVEITTNNVTLNCNGHSITGTGTGYGIYLNSREDVIVQNCTVINFSVGIPLLFASDNTIITSTMSDNHYSIVLAGSFSNTLTDNNALNNWVGIMLNPSSNANNLTNNDASNNLGFGILLRVNSDNILTNNTALNNNVGIHLYRSSGNTLKNNIMSANTYNFGVSGVNLSDYIQDIDISNKVNGKPVYYWVGQQNRQVPDDAGYVGIVNSTSITVKDLTLKNDLEGVMLAFSDNSKIENVNALNNLFGISFFSSSNNTITNSTATNNGAIGIYLTLSSNNTITVNTFSNNRDWGIRLNSSSGNVLTNNEVSYNYGLLGGGIYLMYNSDNNVLADNDILDHYFGIRLRGFSENYPDDNKIYHNNFINNLIQAHALYGGTGNLFDDGYPSGGNYWSDYMGVDLYSGAGQNESGSDGIGDSHYTFTDGQDDYPFMEEDGWKAPERIRPDRAVELAKMVIGRDYKSEWGNSLTKGYFWNVINKKYIFLSSEEIEYLDCSGLSFWSYNRAYFDGKELLAEEFENRSLYYFGANGQYLGNIDKKLELTKEELRPGDLLFFDTWNRNTETYGQDGIMDHVAMHIGLHEGEQHAVEHAHVGEDDTDNAGKISVTTVDGLIDYYKARFGERAFVDFGRVIDAKVEMKFTGHSPIDLIVTDPDGETIYENVGQREAISELGDIGDNLTMSYMVYDIDGDGEPDDIVASPERKIGDYLITVVPEPGALPTDTYTLTVEALVNGEMATVVLAENVLISDIPRTPYIITSTETEITPIIPAFIDFNPDTLNLQSRGKWVTTYIELPRGYDINDIDSESIELNCQVPVETKPIEIGDYDSNGIPDLMVKFNQSAVQNILEVGDEVKLTLTGRLFDGTQYEGSDTIQVIRRGLLANLSILFASLHRAISQLLNLLQNNFFILWLES